MSERVTSARLATYGVIVLVVAVAAGVLGDLFEYSDGDAWWLLRTVFGAGVLVGVCLLVAAVVWWRRHRSQPQGDH